MRFNLIYKCFFLIIIICKAGYYDSPYTRNAVSVNNDSVILTIEPCTYEFTDSLIIHVTVENKTGIDFNILNNPFVTMSSAPSYTWDLLILFNDSIRMISPINFLDLRILFPPPVEYYFLVESGGKYTFDFCLDFSRLARANSKFGPTNQDYGEYYLKLSYKDKYCSIKDALCDHVESNLLRVEYIKTNNKLIK